MASMQVSALFSCAVTLTNLTKNTDRVAVHTVDRCPVGAVSGSYWR